MSWYIHTRKITFTKNPTAMPRREPMRRFRDHIVKRVELSTINDESSMYSVT